MKRLLYGLLCVFTFIFAACDQVEPDQTTPTPQVQITAGLCTETEIEFLLAATNADEVVYHVVQVTDEVQVFTAEALFKTGEVFAATKEPLPHTVSDLLPETEYTVYAAARKNVDDQEVLYSDVEELVIKTAEKPKLIEFVDASKTGFTYKLNSEEGQMVYHTYFEGWFFEYSYESTKYADGDQFDLKVFLWNMLAMYGEPAEAPGEIEWYAGKENLGRSNNAFLVPGMTYYALAAVISPDGMSWLSDPSIIQFKMDDPGKSNESIECKVEGLTPYSTNIRMEMDPEKVSFYMYLFVEETSYKLYVAENGKEALPKYVSEYSLDMGQAKVNTYTDTWTINPGTSYRLLLYGVDRQGDEFYQELTVTSPIPDPSMSIYLTPYERDLEGYNTYNTLKMDCSMANFIDLDYENSVYFLSNGPVKRADFDKAVQEAGLSGTLEELQEKGEEMQKLAQSSLGLDLVSTDSEYLAAIKNGSYSKIYSGLEADTEYIFMMTAIYDGKTICRLASAKTDPTPTDAVPTEQYLNFIGNWTVTGTKSVDYTPVTYDIKIEQMTVNRSYKVYGWSTQQVGQDFPFEAGFDPETGKMTIHTPQNLGKATIDGKEYEVRLVGKVFDTNTYSDVLMALPDFDGLTYLCRIDPNYDADTIVFTPQYVSYGFAGGEFKSIAYVWVDENGDYFSTEENMNDIINFHVQRVK